MSEDAPQSAPVDESQRVEDPEKALVMASAGNDLRGFAANRRLTGQNLNMQRLTPDVATLNAKLAAVFDKRAEGKEEDAGREFDEEQARKAAERIIDRASDTN